MSHTMEAALSLGSNLGDRLANLCRARLGLAHLPLTSVMASSPVYETEPVDVPECHRSAGFLNAVVVVETRLAVAAFSDAIHALEAELGRRRGSEHHAPRLIDIDIIYFGDLTRTDVALRLPHAEWMRRRFVCAPLADVRPDLVLPGQTQPVRRVLAALPATPSAVLAAEQW
jgi:2-amino-4-hydroxy-6-hydroxymethyldihydropteridine diphosphokinase